MSPLLQTVISEYGYPAFIYYSLQYCMCKKMCIRLYAEIMRINKLVINSMCFGKHAIQFCDFDAQGANAGVI